MQFLISLNCCQHVPSWSETAVLGLVCLTLVKECVLHLKVKAQKRPISCIQKHGSICPGKLPSEIKVQICFGTWLRGNNVYSLQTRSTLPTIKLLLSYNSFSLLTYMVGSLSGSYLYSGNKSVKALNIATQVQEQIFKVVFCFFFLLGYSASQVQNKQLFTIQARTVLHT